MKSRRAANDRGIISEPAVAVQLYELIEQALNEIKRVRAIRVAGQLHTLKRSRAVGRGRRRFFCSFFPFGFSHVLFIRRKCPQTLGTSDQVDATTLWSALAWQRFGRSRPVTATPAWS